MSKDCPDCRRAARHRLSEIHRRSLLRPAVALDLVERLIKRLGGPDAAADMLADCILEALAEGKPDAAGRILVAMFDAGRSAAYVAAKVPIRLGKNGKVRARA